jgi:hypothetical protein
MSRRRNIAIGLGVLLGAALLALIIMAGITLHEVEEVETSVCPYQESLACWDGNACHAPLMKRICPIVEGNNQRTSLNPACAAANFVCENPAYADGTCCNQNDFCFLNDPNKTCQAGQCVSTDVTLCKGYCLTDDDCTTALIPLYPSITNAFTFCLNGACFTYVYTDSNVITPNDLLNLTTMGARNISACLESVCFVLNFGEGDILICQFAWKCSQLNGFSDQSRKKREIMEEAQQTRLLHNFTLPGGNGRYTRDQYRQANEALNAKLVQFVNSWRTTDQPVA